MFIIVCLFVPIATMIPFSKNILEVIGMDEQVSTYAQTYLNLMLPSVLFNSLGDSIDLFLIGMGYNKVVLLL